MEVCRAEMANSDINVDSENSPIDYSSSGRSSVGAHSSQSGVKLETNSTGKPNSGSEDISPSGTPGGDKKVRSCRSAPSSSHTNKYGRTFQNGRPLPDEMRLEILKMDSEGVRPCDISRQLQVSHGCVSKILMKYRKTGNVKPGTIGGSRPKVTIPSVADRIHDIKRENRAIFAWQIRKILISEGLCNYENAPSISSINRVIRCRWQLNDMGVEVEIPNSEGTVVSLSPTNSPQQQNGWDTRHTPKLENNCSEAYVPQTPTNASSNEAFNDLVASHLKQFAAAPLAQPATSQTADIINANVQALLAERLRQNLKREHPSTGNGATLDAGAAATFLQSLAGSSISTTQALTLLPQLLNTMNQQQALVNSLPFQNCPTKPTLTNDQVTQRPHDDELPRKMPRVNNGTSVATDASRPLDLSKKLDDLVQTKGRTKRHVLVFLGKEFPLCDATLPNEQSDSSPTKRVRLEDPEKFFMTLTNIAK